MFKKPSEVKSLQRLSGADRKKLRRTVKEKFPRASNEDIDTILPPKAEITVSKYPNRVHVYGIEGGCPVFFDIDGRGTEIYPAVYALWKVPELLPSFLLKAGEVSSFIIDGADLMFPGISISSDGLPSFLAGEPWAVKVPGNPAPIAVGSTTMSSVEAQKAGLRGKAVRITHCYRDYLWESIEDCYVPNAGFLDRVVLEDPALCSGSQASGSSGDSSNVLDQEFDHEDTSESLDISDSHSRIVEMSEEVSTVMSELSVSENLISEVSITDKELESLSREEVDVLLDKCLLQALHTTVKDKDLPLPGSSLWSSYILPCRPSGITLDIKRSSHKKLSKWLQSKSSSGLISVKEDKYKKESMLLGIDRNHPDYTSFKPEKKSTENISQNSTVANEGSQVKLEFEVVEIYKSSSHVNPILAAIGADTGKFFNGSEATDLVFRYVEKENLVKPTDKSFLVLDPILCDALYKGAIKKGSSYPTEIHKKDLGPMFLSRMQAHHRVSRGNGVAVIKGAVRPIQIMSERRQGNKKVTKVSGFESFLIDAEPLASELQKKFACSTSVGEAPGKKGQNEVLVQGGVIDDLARHLIDHYGVPKRYIEVLDKTKK